MTIWKPVYEIQANKTVSIGNEKLLYDIADYGCDLKVRYIDDSKTKPYSSIIKCDQIMLFDDQINTGESNVACGWFQNMATDSRDLDLIKFNDTTMFHYYVWYNSNGVVSESRWLDGEYKQISEQTFPEYHTKWYAEADCIGVATPSYNLHDTA